MPEYYTRTYVGNPVDIAKQVEVFCQEMNYRYPDTFQVVSATMTGTAASASYIMIYTA